MWMDQSQPCTTLGWPLTKNQCLSILSHNCHDETEVVGKPEVEQFVHVHLAEEAIRFYPSD